MSILSEAESHIGVCKSLNCATECSAPKVLMKLTSSTRLPPRFLLHRLDLDQSDCMAYEKGVAWLT